MVRRTFILKFVAPLLMGGTSILGLLVWRGHKLSTPKLSINARALLIEVRNLSPKPAPWLQAVIPYVYTSRGKGYRYNRHFPGIGASLKELKNFTAKYPPGSELKVYFNKEPAQHLGTADAHATVATDY